MINEAEYQAYWNKVHSDEDKAKKLYSDILELYPDLKCDTYRLLLKARRDGIITDDERRLIREYIH